MTKKLAYEELEQRLDELEKETARRKQAERSLKKSEEEHQTILESIEDGYYEVNIPGDFTLVNDSFCKILGYSKEEITGTNYKQHMDQENTKTVYQAFNKVFRTGQPTKEFEHQILRRDGAKRYLDISVSLIKDSEGNGIGFRGIMRDITERRQAEGGLIRTKSFLQNIFNSSIDGITSTDLHGNILYTSPRIKDILGYDQSEIIGKEISFLYSNGLEDAKAIMKQLMATGELRNREMKLIKKDGELVDISVSASLLRDEKGEVIGTLGIYRNVTELRRLEVQLKQAQMMESVGTLAGGIAHNFNNLLMAIQGNVSLMLRMVDNEHPTYARLGNIEKLVQSGSKLTRQLLGYAREGGYQIKSINLNRVVKETADTFAMARKKVKVHEELAEDLCVIMADQGQIEQVLLNLYVNASDAMPEGGHLFLKTINVTARDMTGRLYRPRPGNYILLSVADTGIGMDKKSEQHIFEPFYTTKPPGKGTGLGLASVYGTVKAHGGYIDVESEMGQGTNFKIYLPASEKKIAKEKRLRGEMAEGTGTILFVDDEHIITAVGKQMLKGLGYEVLLARSGKEALGMYKDNREKIDLVILDMILPGMSGGETCERLREINPRIKVLLSSGNDMNSEVKGILEQGCNGFIQKPFNMTNLSEKLRQVFEQG
ncbi:MAG: PAS domain S-box protein [Desulfobacteraceae bacterium]|nr:PAS domain S-box protein [Desulfobacteraceae bacterium]